MVYLYLKAFVVSVLTIKNPHCKQHSLNDGGQADENNVSNLAFISGFSTNITFS